MIPSFLLLYVVIDFTWSLFTPNSMTIQRETYQICSTVTRSKLHMNYRVDDFGMNLEGRRLLFSEWRRSFWHKLNIGDVVSRAAPRPTARRPSTPHPRETWSLETSTTESAHQEMRIDCSAFKKFFFLDRISPFVIHHLDHTDTRSYPKSSVG